MSNGRFVWRDLQTSDIAAAKTFYGELLGWTFEEVDMGGMTYTMFGFPSDNFGGMMPLDASSDAPSHWSSYLTVDDVDAALKNAERLGATVSFGPHDIPDVGRFTGIGDPQGAAVNLFTPLSSEDTDPPMTPPAGGVSWNELLTDDPAAAIEFYGQIVDWTTEKSTMSHDMDYWVAKQGKSMRASIMMKPPIMPVSAWLIYFAVSNIDDAVARVKALGGMAYGVTTVEGVGTFTYASDPAGAPFGLIEE